MSSNTATLEQLKACLLDESKPVALRNHASFLLRTMGTLEAAQVICEALKNRSNSQLLRHEFAYILGQMQFSDICPALSEILDDETEDTLVRHESAEALGAIGLEQYLPVLEKYCTHSLPEISETCQIAVDLVKWKASQADKGADADNIKRSTYLSHDPAPSFNTEDSKSIEELSAILQDTSSSLFTRYRAMFTLRDINNDASALALVGGLSDASALFRHEVAYVLGQMQRAVTVPGLTASLRNAEEHAMVRHEAAEALGAIGGAEVEKVLEEFKSDVHKVVEESCLVALNTIDYWSSNVFADGSSSAEGAAAAIV